MRYLRVKNWEEYQHYKDRRPPWIKLHESLLDDYEFAALSDTQKAHLMLIWLLAGKMENKIPLDPEWLKRKIVAQTKVDLDAFVQAGFLIVIDQNQEEEGEKWASRHIPEPVKTQAMERAGGKCEACGTEQDLEYDHIIPVSKGGKSEIDNIQILCRPCNRRKRTRIKRYADKGDSVASCYADDGGLRSTRATRATRSQETEAETETEKENQKRKTTAPEPGAQGGVSHPRIAWSTGAIPADVVASLDLLPTNSNNASTFQHSTGHLLRSLGFEVKFEVRCADRGDGRPGKIDLVGVRGGEVLAIECDRGKSRDKSIEKLRRFRQTAMVVLREVPEPMPEVPSSLDTPEFHAALADYIAVRREAGFRPLPPASLRAQYERMEQWGVSGAIEALRFSQAQCYGGVVQPGRNGSGPKQQSAHRSARPKGLVLPEGFEVKA